MEALGIILGTWQGLLFTADVSIFTDEALWTLCSWELPSLFLTAPVAIEWFNWLGIGKEKDTHRPTPCLLLPLVNKLPEVCTCPYHCCMWQFSTLSALVGKSIILENSVLGSPLAYNITQSQV